MKILWSILAVAVMTVASTGFAEQIMEEGVSTPTSWCALKKIKISPEKNDFQIIFTGDSHDVLSVETITFGHNNSWQSYVWDQKQTGEQTKLDYDGKTLKFTYKEKDKAPEEKTTTIDSDEKDQVVVPPLLSVYARQHWREIEKNGQLDVVIAAPDRRDIFRFRFKKEQTSDPKLTDLVLKAKSPFVALAVSPIHFVFDQDLKLVAIKGFNPPVKYKSKSGDLDSKKIDMDFKTFAL